MTLAPHPVTSAIPRPVEGPRPHVLVVEDDAEVAAILHLYLEREGYDVETVGDGIAGLRRTHSGWPDVMVLDLSLPQLDGLEVCRRTRAAALSIPIIILSARAEEPDRILGFDCGADDYLCKPFSPRELVARVRAALRRAPTNPTEWSGDDGRICCGGIVLDHRTREVTVDSNVVDLRPREFELLSVLMARAGEVLHRDVLLTEVWGYSFGGAGTLSVHIRRLREKVETNPAQPRHIKTVWGVGYRFDP